MCSSIKTNLKTIDELNCHKKYVKKIYLILYLFQFNFIFEYCYTHKVL